MDPCAWLQKCQDCLSAWPSQCHCRCTISKPTLKPSSCWGRRRRDASVLCSLHIQNGEENSTEAPEDTVEGLLLYQPAQLSEDTSFAEEQRKDPLIAEVITFLETGELPQEDKKARRIALQKPLFVLQGGVLFFCNPKRRQHLRVVVPAHLRQQIILDSHSGLMGGHFSAKRTYTAHIRHWWWDGMYHDTIQLVANCPQCAIATGGSHQHYPPLHPITSQPPIQIIGVNIMELPTTDQGNRYVLVFQDFLTKWPMVFAMPDQKSVRIA